MELTSWTIWTLFLVFINLFNLCFFFFEIIDREYRKYLYIKIMIFSISFIFYIFIFLLFYDFIFLLFIFLLFIIYFSLKKYLTFNDITLFWIFGLIFSPLIYRVGSKLIQTGDMYSGFLNIVILSFVCLILFLTNIVVQINNSAKRNQQSNDKDKPDEL